MSKEILFYSDRCDYSMKIYNCIKNKESILKVCIDDPNIKLPTFVTAVPLIYIPKDKRIIIDDAVELWVKTNMNVSSNMEVSSPNQVQQTFKSSSSPSGEYFTGGFSFSSTFSALDGEDINGLDGGCGFADLSSPLQGINTPKDDGVKMDTNAMFEQYQKMRNKDIAGKSKN